MERTYFIVTSHGWSASNWVAHSLNLHPDIVCSHSARNALANDKDLQSNENLKKHINQLHKGYVSRQERSLDSSYDEIEQMGQGRYCGSVHLYRLRDLPVVQERFNAPQRKFEVMNVVRHPVDLVWSGYGQFRDLFRYDINELHWTLGKVLSESREFVFGIGDKYQLNLGDFENLAFIGAACVLGSLRKDLDALPSVKQLPYLNFKGHVKMEDITTDRVAYSQFISQLIPGINITDAYLDEVFATGQINKHKHDQKRITPAERYAALPEWQKEVFGYYFDRYKLHQPYSEIGYDLSFVQSPVLNSQS